MEFGIMNVPAGAAFYYAAGHSLDRSVKPRLRFVLYQSYPSLQTIQNKTGRACSGWRDTEAANSTGNDASIFLT
jgi:hypothetical protein